MIKAFITDLRVSKAPEIKSTATGTTYTNVLCSVYVGKDRQTGNNKYLNVRVAMFGKTAERAAELQQGTLINVVANVADISHYVRQDGNISNTLELTADTYERPLGSKSHDTAQQPAAQPSNNFTSGAAGFEDGEDSEDLPF